MTEQEQVERTIRILKSAFKDPDLSSTDRKYVKGEIMRLTEAELEKTNPIVSEKKIKKPIKKNEPDGTKLNEKIEQNDVNNSQNYTQNIMYNNQVFPQNNQQKLDENSQKNQQNFNKKMS